MVGEGLRATCHQFVKARRGQPAPVPGFAVLASLGENTCQLTSVIRIIRGHRERIQADNGRISFTQFGFDLGKMTLCRRVERARGAARLQRTCVHRSAGLRSSTYALAGNPEAPAETARRPRYRLRLSVYRCSAAWVSPRSACRLTRAATFSKLARRFRASSRRARASSKRPTAWRIPARSPLAVSASSESRTAQSMSAKASPNLWKVARVRARVRNALASSARRARAAPLSLLP